MVQGMNVIPITSSQRFETSESVAATKKAVFPVDECLTQLYVRRQTDLMIQSVLAAVEVQNYDTFVGCAVLACYQSDIIQRLTAEVRELRAQLPLIAGGEVLNG